ncbi:Ribose-phosphate pyrophosphokinase [hydrothermal vent metagenome]|uniref:ribose-phosphate diphosphokinase n=1 Tax=hydrothermal vent metagenome TaxID=652676 RepID=A0A3B0V6S3_9ZZZZ
MLDRVKIFSGNSNKELAEEICSGLGMELSSSEIKKFSDGEINVKIKESVRGMDTYVVQSTSPPCNDHLMELLLMLDAFKRASARSITAVIPYYGYSRQDRKAAPRTPISAKLVADLIQVAGATRVVCMDLHAGQIQGFFNIPVDNIYATPVLLDYMNEKFIDDDVVIVSPDAGGVERARAFAKRIHAGLAIVDKRRPEANISEVMHIIGEVEGKTTILLDDMVDTAGTLTQAAKALKAQGAKAVYACCSHGVLSGPAIERIEGSDLEELVVTNTIPRRDGNNSGKVKYLSAGRLLAEAVKRIHCGESVSSLFV